MPNISANLIALTETEIAKLLTEHMSYHNGKTRYDIKTCPIISLIRAWSIMTAKVNKLEHANARHTKDKKDCMYCKWTADQWLAIIQRKIRWVET